MERKLASVLFVDLVNSSELVASADPEVVRRRVTRFFDQVAHCVTTHGGIVEKFAGDAVLAAFGVPQAHEDDTERAIRAGFGILEAVATLGLEARVGIESGEVVYDEADSTFATGSAVNLAARLQQAAEPGTILVGPGAHRLAHDCIEFEDVGPLAMRGSEAAVWAWRAVAVARARGVTGVTAPFIGREDERELLENTYSRAVRHRRAHLLTVYGEPGVGKSRLAREFVDGLDGATVLSGRCLPYGEGVTYWPLAEMVKAASGIADSDPAQEAVEKLRECCESDAVADLLGLAAGVLEAVEGERAPQEIAWAARRWAEQLAADQPLVLVFEDIHWGEEPMLDLIEHLADWVREAPLLLLCLARAELLDVRPGWGGGRVRSQAIELEPLPPEESEQLVDALIAEVGLADGARSKVLEKTEGNPLFVEETIRMLAEADGDGRARIPDTLQALIAARIDGLPPRTKALLQRAAVIGRVFWSGALEHLSPDGEDVEPLLDDLLLRDFVSRERRSTIREERALKFKHVLIREVAYGGLSKSSRAEYHARFAAWLGERTGEELLEIRAYHLDQACALHAELDGDVPAALRAEAAATLQAAGKRALAREAFHTSRKLLLRAAELEPSLERRFLAARAAWRLGDLPTLAREMEAVRAEAEEAGDARTHGRALTALSNAALFHRADVALARELAEQALDVLEAVDDPIARFDALNARADVASWLGDVDDYERYSKVALEVAREAQRKDLETLVTQGLAMSAIGHLDLAQAEQLVRRAAELAEESGSIIARAFAYATRARLDRVLGRYDEAEVALEEAWRLFTDVGQPRGVAHVLMNRGRLRRERGEIEAAEKDLREAVRLLAQNQDRGTLCEAQRSLAELLAVRGKLDDAERHALDARETVGPEDRVSGPTTTLSLGFVRAAQGRDDEAETLMRTALADLRESPFRAAEREALGTLSAFLQERGRDDDAEPLLARLAELDPDAASAAQSA